MFLSEIRSVADHQRLVNPDSLSEEDIEFFKDYGYLVKPNLIDNRQQIEDALDFAWDYLLENLPVDPSSNWTLSKHNPETWHDPKWAKMPPPAASGFYEGRQRINYAATTIKLHDVGSKDVFVNLLPNHENVRKIATQLLGPELRPSTRTRGVYAVLPRKLNEAERQSRINAKSLGPHCDRVCQQLNVCTYLENVPPRGGGFTIYPGSHKIMFQAHETESNWSPRPDFRDYLREAVSTITPVELVANAGDVIFWHGRMVHTAGIHVGSNIRWALFGDFMRDEKVLSDDEHRVLGQYEWFKDTKLLDKEPRVTSDMWRNWRLVANSVERQPR